MTATATPLATSVRGEGKQAVPVTRREADEWLRREHPELSRSAREKLASAVPRFQLAHPRLSVWEWLAWRAGRPTAGQTVFYRGHGGERTYANAERWNPDWKRGDSDA